MDTTEKTSWANQADIWPLEYFQPKWRPIYCSLHNCESRAWGTWFEVRDKERDMRKHKDIHYQVDNENCFIGKKNLNYLEKK